MKKKLPEISDLTNLAYKLLAKRGEIMKKRPEISDITKDNLQTAFWKLYETKSVSQIAIKEITDFAGYNRGTFYIYYKDVYDILEQVENAILLETEENFKLILENIENIQMMDLMKFALTISKLHDKHMKVLLSEHGDPKFVSKYKNITKEFLRDNFRRNFKENNLDEEYLLEFFVSGLLGTIRKWYEDEQNLPVDEFSEIIIKFFSKNFN